jgi:hypothetical protein
MTTIIKPEDMPAPETLVDYDDGGLMAAMFHYAEAEADLSGVANENGFHCLVCALLDPDLMKLYEAGENVLTKWRPEPPMGWILGGVYDTDEGPYALFLRSTDGDAEVEAAE